MANLLQLPGRLSPDDCAVLSVNLDADRSAAASVVRRLNLPWPVGFGGQGFKGPLATRFLGEATAAES